VAVWCNIRGNRVWLDIRRTKNRGVDPSAADDPAEQEQKRHGKYEPK
jgi:hypothetical protein